MCKILLSINPQHVQNILNGSKRFEFRKVRCRKDVTTIVIYSTSPVMKVVGEAKINEILENSPEKLWTETSEWAGIEKNFFDEYYEGREKAVAYSIESVSRYDDPRPLSDYGISSPPQSFTYLD